MGVKILYHGDEAVGSWAVTPHGRLPHHTTSLQPMSPWDNLFTLFTPYGGATQAWNWELTKRLIKKKKFSRITPEDCCCEQQDIPHKAAVSLRACAMVTLRQSWVRSRLGKWKEVVGLWEEVVACLQNTNTFVSNGWCVFALWKPGTTSSRRRNIKKGLCRRAHWASSKATRLFLTK